MPTAVCRVRLDHRSTQLPDRKVPTAPPPAQPHSRGTTDAAKCLALELIWRRLRGESVGPIVDYLLAWPELADPTADVLDSLGAPVVPGVLR